MTTPAEKIVAALPEVADKLVTLAQVKESIFNSINEMVSLIVKKNEDEIANQVELIKKKVLVSAFMDKYLYMNNALDVMEFLQLNRSVDDEKIEQVKSTVKKVADKEIVSVLMIATDVFFTRGFGRRRNILNALKDIETPEGKIAYNAFKDLA